MLLTLLFLRAHEREDVGRRRRPEARPSERCRRRLFVPPVGGELAPALAPVLTSINAIVVKVTAATPRVRTKRIAPPARGRVSSGCLDERELNFPCSPMALPFLPAAPVTVDPPSTTPPRVGGRCRKRNLTATFWIGQLLRISAGTRRGRIRFGATPELAHDFRVTGVVSRSEQNLYASCVPTACCVTTAN